MPRRQRIWSDHRWGFSVSIIVVACRTHRSCSASSCTLQRQRREIEWMPGNIQGSFRLLRHKHFAGVLRKVGGSSRTCQEAAGESRRADGLRWPNLLWKSSKAQKQTENVLGIFGRRFDCGLYERIVRIGLTYDDGFGKLEFVHRTFAEYFIADFFFDGIFKKKFR